MKTKNLSALLLGLLLSTLNVQLSTIFAQGTAFTYQGRLTDNGGPANGRYDFIFVVFDAASGGNSLGGSVNANNIGVSNGLFTVLLDFGPNVFNGHPNFFLEVGVRAAGGGEFTTLSPRQPVTPSPYAIHAGSATKLFNGAVARLNNLSDDVTLAAGQNVTITPSGNTLTIGASGINPWQVNGSNTFYLAGNVGIGIAAPNAPLHIAKRVPVLALQGESTTSTQVGLVSFRNSAGAETGWLGFGSSGNADATFMNNRSGGRTSLGAGGLERLTVTSSGDAGIGTTTPQAQLDVRGDIRLGASGQLRATSGAENLRIIRGVVAANGSIIAGSGFTVTHNSDGNYLIIFDTPFLGAPSVTATVDRAGTTGENTIMTDGATSASARLLTRSNQALGSAFLDFPFHFIAVGPR